MSDDDKDKTVFGQPLPPTPPQPQGGNAAPSGEHTIFGQPLPPAGQGWGVAAPPPDPRMGQPAPGAVQPPPYGQPAPPAAPDPWNNPGADDTWLGGALNPQPGFTPQPPPQPHPQPYPQGYPQTPPQQAPAGQGWPPHHPPQGYPPQQPPPQGYAPRPVPGYVPETGRRDSPEFFPEIPREQAPQPQQERPRIPLAEAMRATGIGAGGSTNPLVAASANLLVLLGRLRTGLVEMQAAPLLDHVAREIDLFERNALAAGVNPTDVTDAKYALSATADDIVQNLPGADRGTWLEYSMIARFFGERSSGVGFFKKVDDAMRAPAQRFNLLELILTCLSLGFEGQYRALPNGSVELSRIRGAIYETLRRVQPRPDDDISVRWEGVPLQARKRRGALPVWAIAGVAVAMLVSLYATLTTLLNQQSSETGEVMISLHQGLPAVTIERTQPVIEPYVAPDTARLERIRAAMAEEIEANRVVVDRNNDWIFIRVGEYLRFAPAAADLQSEFEELAQKIAATLDVEIGPIRVVGHTDSDPLSARARFRTNEQLSKARAQTVADLIKPFLTDPERLEIEGVGASEPIAENTTREGKAQNRRVEILIQREN